MNHAVRRIVISAIALCAFSHAVASANPALERVVKVEIAAQSLSSALIEFSRQANIQVITPTTKVSALSTQGVTGEMTLAAALAKLLEGTQLRFHAAGKNTVGLDDGTNAETSRLVSPDSPDALRVAQAEVPQSIQSRTSEAGATSSPSEQEARDSQALNEVVVTATRREESIQDVPISVTALSETDLQQRGAKDFEGFVRTVPGLSMTSARESQPLFVIRGISTESRSGNTQLPVATYVDDLPSFNSYAPVYTLDLRLFDVERVEVLRGPQGTLFGSGAVGGAIRVLTQKPDASAFAAKAEITGSTTRAGQESYGLDAMINLPLIDERLALRIVGYDAVRGGYVDNSFRGKDVNEIHVRGGRAMLAWTPRDDLSVMATFMTQEKRVEDDAFVFATPGSLEWDGGAANSDDARFDDFNVVVNWDLGPATLTSSTNYATEKARPSTDLSPYFGPGVTIDIDSTANFLTQEFRLASNSDGPFSYLVGGFYIQRDRRYQAALYDPTGTLLYAEDSDLPTEEAALFGELSYQVTPTLRLTAGARAFHNENSDQSTVRGLLIGGVAIGAKRKSTEEKLTPKFAVTWEPNRDLTMYAVASQGYRTGHVNPVVPPDPSTGSSRESAYGPDSLWNFELGAKSYFFARKLRANLALFNIDWRDIQINLQYPDTFNYTANAGKASSRGAELELDARPVKGLTLSTAMSYVDAQLDEDAPSIGGEKGNRLPGSSRFQISNAIQYEAPLTGDLAGRLRFEHQYIGSALTSIDSTVARSYGDYDIFNLRLGLFRGAYEATLFVDNLRDSRASVFASNVGDPFPMVVRLRPRTVGLTLRAAF